MKLQFSIAQQKQVFPAPRKGLSHHRREPSIFTAGIARPMHSLMKTRFALNFLAALQPLVTFAAAPAPASERPNILWISCEDMSPYLGCYGDKNAITPNLDRLASQGARYNHVFPSAPVCAPSRSGLITGMYATSIGSQHMRSKVAPPPYVKCFPEYLRAAGYYCTNNVKTDYNFVPPLTAWDENSKKAHWKNRPAGAPFFAVFNITTTHESKFHQGNPETEAALRTLTPEERHDPARMSVPPYLPDTDVVRKDIAKHYDMITAMDKEAGALLKELEDDGLSSNTIVFFFSDHGSALPRGKRWVYDSGLHVPLIIRYPGKLEAGSIREEMVSFIDFAPTMLRLAGVEVPSHLQGHAFLPTQEKPRQYVFAARDRVDEVYDIIRCVRDKQYKYIRNFEPEKPYAQLIGYGEKTPTLQEWRRLHSAGKLNPVQELFFRPQKPKEELYDCVADPHEVKDLASDPAHRETLERLRAELDKWQKETGDLGLVPETEMQERMYPGGVIPATAAPEAKIEERDGKLALTLKSSTEGASIAWRKGEGGRRQQWEVYAGPIAIDSPTTITAKAVRIGWKDSPEVVEYVGTAR